MNMVIGSANWDSVLQLFVVLVIFIFVLGITVVTTKWIGGYQKAQITNKNMKLVEMMRLGNNKTIGLIEVGQVYLVVGIGKDEIHTIAKLTKEELPEVLDGFQNKSMETKLSFQEILNNLKKNKG